MKQFLLLFAILFGLWCPALQAEAADTDVATLSNTLYSTPQQVTPGQTIDLALLLKNEQVVTGFQVDIVLPQGFEFVRQTGRYCEATLSTVRQVSTKTHSLQAKLQDDGSLRVLCYSSHCWPFDGNDGEVATIRLKVMADAPIGPAVIWLKEMVLTDKDGGSTIEASDVCLTLTVTPTFDHNRDLHVDVADVITLVNDPNHTPAAVTRLVEYILSQPEE